MAQHRDPVGTIGRELKRAEVSYLKGINTALNTCTRRIWELMRELEFLEVVKRT